MKAYIYILNGKPVINPKEKPTRESYNLGGRPGNPDKWEMAFEETCEEWESNCIEVENARKSDLSFIGGAWKDRWYITTVINEADYEQTLTPGSQVEHDGPVITKIL